MVPWCENTELRWHAGWLHRDAWTEAFEPAHKAALDSVAIPLMEVVETQVAVRLSSVDLRQ